MEEETCDFCRCPPSKTWFQILASSYTLRTPDPGASHGAQVWEHSFLRESFLLHRALFLASDNPNTLFFVL